MTNYIPTETYHTLVDALATVPLCIVTGLPSREEIMRILGEIGGIWPDAIRPAIVDGEAV